MNQKPHRLPFHALLFFASAALAVGSPLSPDDALKAFQLADPALRVELVAAEPLVMSPCAMAFDERGRLFVAENRGYPNMATPPQGTIALLEDTDADGRMDKRTVFADSLTFPNGVMPWRGGVIVTCAPDVLFLKDTDGNGKADEKRVLLTGFATSGSTQLRVNCPTLGPDGWIYFAAGLSGGDITSPDHPARPALKMTGDLRWNPQTGEIENVDGRSQYGMSFDDFGRRFICMNRVPVQHVVLSSKILARNPHLAFSETVQDCNERCVKTGLKGGGDGVRLFPISKNITTADSHAGSFSAACAITIWRGGALPEKYRGGAFTCDPTANIVHVDRLDPRGATFAAVPMFEKEQREFLASRDDWHRPVFLATGPDGALYVCDMYRKTIEHPEYLPEEIRKRTDFESGKEMGRIWRVIAAEKSATWLAAPAASGKSGEPPRPLAAGAASHDAPPQPSDLFSTLGSEIGWQRQTAFRLTLERNAQASAELRKLIRSDANIAARVAAVWLHSNGETRDEALLENLLFSPEPRLREAAMKSAAEFSPKAFALNIERLAAQASDSDPQVRLSAALLLGETKDQETAQGLARAVIVSMPDRWMRAAVLSSVSNIEGQLLAALFPELEDVDAGAMDLLHSLGRSFPDVESLKATLMAADKQSAAFGREGIGPALCSMLLGVAERSGKRLEPKGTDEWLKAILNGLGNVAKDPAESLVQRQLIIRLLGHTTWTTAHATLEQLAVTEPAHELRIAAIASLASFDEPPVVPTLLAKDHWANATPEIRETILSALLARTTHLEGVLAALENGALPSNALSPQRRALFLKHKDPALRERAEKLFGTTIAGDRTKAFDDAKAALALKANAERGRELFKTLCASCHRLDREGFAVGPDLFDMRNQPKESILFHVVVPEAEVAPAFAAYLVETKDGRTLSGVLTSETATSLTLRMPLGAEETILRANTTRIEAMPGSLMPAGLEAAMSRQGLADLLGYLKGER